MLDNIIIFFIATDASVTATPVNVWRVLQSMAHPGECVGASTIPLGLTAMSVCRSSMTRRGAERPHQMRTSVKVFACSFSSYFLSYRTRGRHPYYVPLLIILYFWYPIILFILIFNTSLAYILWTVDKNISGMRKWYFNGRKKLYACGYIKIFFTNINTFIHHKKVPRVRHWRCFNTSIRYF